MSHQPYESWLISDDPMTPDQHASLLEHLQFCDSCQRLKDDWVQVERVLITKPIKKPIAGFTKRWQTRLANLQKEEQAYLDRKSSIIFLSLTASLTVLTVTFMLIYSLSAYESSAQILVGGISFLTGVYTFFSLSQQLLETFIQVFSALIPPVWWFVFAVAGGLLSLVWVEFLRRVMFSRRIVQ
jgi:hypothetical protein